MSLDIYFNRNIVCENCGHVIETEEVVHEQNITHNLSTMASALGIYNHLWEPEEIGIKTSDELIEPLRDAILFFEREPTYFRQFDSENGWGTCDQFYPWLKELLAACIEYPNCRITVTK